MSGSLTSGIMREERSGHGNHATEITREERSSRGRRCTVLPPPAVGRAGDAHRGVEEGVAHALEEPDSVIGGTLRVRDEILRGETLPSEAHRRQPRRGAVRSNRVPAPQVVWLEPNVPPRLSPPLLSFTRADRTCAMGTRKDAPGSIAPRICTPERKAGESNPPWHRRSPWSARKCRWRRGGA